MPTAQVQRIDSLSACPAFAPGSAYNEETQAQLWQHCQAHPDRPSRWILMQVQLVHPHPLPSVRHLNRWLRHPRHRRPATTRQTSSSRSNRR